MGDMWKAKMINVTGMVNKKRANFDFDFIACYIIYNVIPPIAQKPD